MQKPQLQPATRAVGQRMRKLRQSLGVSQHDLAELSNVHITSIGRIERGEGNPSLDTMARIATALDTTLSDLVTHVSPDTVQPRELRITAKDLRRARQAQLEAQQHARRSANE